MYLCTWRHMACLARECLQASAGVNGLISSDSLIKAKHESIQKPLKLQSFDEAKSFPPYMYFIYERTPTYTKCLVTILS